jgi:hypothetical protein
MQNPHSEPLLTAKELAAALKRNVKYVYAMKACGFLMPGNRATVGMALTWLVRNPAPRSRVSVNVSNRPT